MGPLNFDVIHHIFELVMELDRIHDHDTPYEALDAHIVERARLRCVSALWNSFIINSPKYWCVIKIQTSHVGIVRFLGLAQDCPLCVYSSASRFDNPDVRDHIKTVLLSHQHQIRTLRFRAPTLFALGRSLVPQFRDLRTLELSLPSESDLPPDKYDNPALRHLSLTFHDRPQDVVFSRGLESLVLRQVDYLNLSLFQALSSCADSLKKLSIRSGAKMVGIPDTISFPRLEELRLQLWVSRTAENVLHAILGPPSMSGIIRTTLWIEELGLVDKLLNFLLPSADALRATATTTVEIESRKSLPTWIEYTRGNRSLQLGLRAAGSDLHFERYRDKLQALNRRLQDPVTSVTILSYKPADMKQLRAFYSSDVQKLIIVLGRPNSQLPIELIDAAIGKRRADHGSGWTFPALRQLTITFNPSYADSVALAAYVDARQAELQAIGYRGLDELVFVHCSFDGINCLDLANMPGPKGVTLKEAPDMYCKCVGHGFRLTEADIV